MCKLSAMNLHTNAKSGKSTTGPAVEDWIPASVGGPFWPFGPNTLIYIYIYYFLFIFIYIYIYIYIYVYIYIYLSIYCIWYLFIYNIYLIISNLMYPKMMILHPPSRCCGARCTWAVSARWWRWTPKRIHCNARSNLWTRNNRFRRTSSMQQAKRKREQDIDANEFDATGDPGAWDHGPTVAPWNHSPKGYQTV